MTCPQSSGHVDYLILTSHRTTHLILRSIVSEMCVALILSVSSTVCYSQVRITGRRPCIHAKLLLSAVVMIVNVQSGSDKPSSVPREEKNSPVLPANLVLDCVAGEPNESPVSEVGVVVRTECELSR